MFLKNGYNTQCSVIEILDDINDEVNDEDEINEDKTNIDNNQFKLN